MKISVIIPFYNLERYVRPCLESVTEAFAQTPDAVELEVICVDDGSTDGTGALLENSARSGATGMLHLRVIHQPNGGEGAARNAGMAAATGDWITFLDGDDVWLENHLAVAVPILVRHPEADMVSFAYEPFEDGQESPKVDGLSARRAAPRRGADVLDVRHDIPDRAILDVGVYPTFYRREFLLGLSFSKLPLGADRLFVAQCLARAKTVVRSETVIHGYRLRSNSMAHCAWSACKVMSQCDYALGSLTVLVESGKKLGRKGQAYLASLWLSDVPNRILRLRGSDRCDAATHWLSTLGARVCSALPRYERARRILFACRCSQTLSLFVARILRKGGLS